MKNRRKLPPKESKKLFTNTAAKVNAKNVNPNPMRGGIRL